MIIPTITGYCSNPVLHIHLVFDGNSETNEKNAINYSQQNTKL
jgi:hypothetical protein